MILGNRILLRPIRDEDDHLRHPEAPGALRTRYENKEKKKGGDR
jgi:hypothetical protein